MTSESTHGRRHIHLQQALFADDLLYSFERWTYRDLRDSTLGGSRIVLHIIDRLVQNDFCSSLLSSVPQILLHTFLILRPNATSIF
jgi:hypothetical protein